MKYLITIITLIFGLTGSLPVIAQQLKLGDNPTVIDKSALLQLDSKNQGLLLPRITDTTLTPLTSAPDGMIIYYTGSADSCLLIRKDGAWVKIVDFKNITSTETDPIATKDTITANQGSGILITGVPGQALGNNPAWTFNADTTLLATQNYVNNRGYLTLSALSGGTGINYNNTTGVIANSGVVSLNGNTGALTMDTSYISNFYQKVRSELSGGAGITYDNNNGIISLTNNTISGVALGNNLNALTAGSGLTGTSTTYNGSAAVTFNADTTLLATQNYVNNRGYLTLSALSAGTGINYNNTTGVIANSGVVSLNGNTGALTMDTSYISNFYQKVRGELSAGSGITYNSTTGQISAVNDGTVTSFSSGNLNPLFTTTVNNATTTPSLSFTASTAPAHTYYGNNTGSSATPGFYQPDTSDIANFHAKVMGTIDTTNYIASQNYVNSKDYLTLTALSGGTGINYDNTTGVISLTNNTISGVSLGNNLNSLTAGSGLTGGTYNGSSAATFKADTTLLATQNYVNAKGYLTSFTETDPVATAKTVTINAGSGLTGGGSATVGSNPNLTLKADTTLLATQNYVNSKGYLTSYTETDPVATAKIVTINAGSGLTGGGSATVGSNPNLTLKADTTLLATQNYVNSKDYLTLSSLSAGTGINYNNATGVISNTGVTSFNGRTGTVLPASGDYNFNQLSGSLAPSQDYTIGTAGTYNNVTVNANGRVTAGSNVSYLTGNQTITLSGDASGSGTTSIPVTLNTVNSNTGSFGNGTNVATFTVNSKGLITAASNTPISFPVTSVNGQTGTVSLGISNMNDATITTPASGQLLQYSGTKWINFTPNYLTLTSLSGGTGITYNNGTGVISLTNNTISGVPLGNNLNSLTAGSGLTGGTYNGSSAATFKADTTLLATQNYVNAKGYITLSSLSGGTGINYNNATGQISATNNGTVTSVGLSLPSIFTVTGSPVTGSGTLTGALATQAANKVFVSPLGSAGTPSFANMDSSYFGGNWYKEVRNDFSGGTGITYNSSTGGISLTNNTISGITLGNNLNALTAGSGLTAASTFNGSSAVTFKADTTLLATQNYVNNKLGTNWQYGGNSVTSIQNLGTTSNYDLPFITNNTERMRILASNGYVGIGTTTPDNPLTVNGQASAIGLYDSANSSGTSKITLAYPSGGNAQIVPLNSADFVWQGGWGDALQMSAYHEIIFTGGTQATTIPAFRTGNGSTYNTRIINTNTNTIGLTIEGVNGQSGDLQRWIVNGNTLDVVNSNGYLGIDKNNPTQALDVSGNVRFSGALMPNNSAGTSGQILVSQGPGNAPVWQDNSSTSGWSLTGNSISGGNFLGTTSNSALVFEVHSTQAGYLGTTSNYETSFGIGSSVSSSYGTAIGANATAGNSYGTAIGYNASATGANSTAIGYNAATSQSNAIVLGNSSSSVGIGTSTPQASLDVNGTFQMGSNGTTLSNMIQNTVSVRLRSSYFSSSNNYTYTDIENVPNVTTGASIIVNPQSTLPTGLAIAWANCTTNGQINITFIDPDGNANIANSNYNFTVTVIEQ